MVTALTVYVHGDVDLRGHVPGSFRPMRNANGLQVYCAYLAGADLRLADDARALFGRLLDRVGGMGAVEAYAEPAGPVGGPWADHRPTLVLLHRERCLAHLARNPGVGLAQLCEAVGLSRGQVRAALGPQANGLLSGAPRGGWGATDEQLLEELRLAASHVDGPLTGPAYDQLAHALGLHSRIRMVQRFGTWRNACARAGVPAARPRRDVYARRWTREQMAQWVARYLFEPGSRGTYAGYDGFARRTPGAPSAQTVRNEFRSWVVVRAEALAAGVTEAA